MLTRFFKPKWQHPDAAVRRRALEEMASDAEDVLVKLARTDPDPEVRCAALKRLSDVLLLEGIIAEDKNPRVKEQATQRLWGLIAGTLPGLAAEERSTVLQRMQDLRLMEHVARHGCDVELRTFAVARVEREPLLVELVNNDGAINVRLAALERIEGGEHLEQICKAAKGRDKRIYRAAKERLERYRREQELPRELQQRFAALCLRAEALLRCSSMDGVTPALTQLQAQWLELAKETDPDPENISRFAEAVVAIGEMEQAYSERAAMREHGPEKLCANVELLLAEMEVGNLGEEALLDLGKRLADTEQAWRQVRTEADDEERELFFNASRKLREGLGAVRQHLDIRQRGLAVAEQAEHLLAMKKVVSGQQLASLKREWPAGTQDDTAKLPSKRFNSAIAELEKRLEAQRAAAADKISQAERLLGALEQALEKGESRSASTLQKQLGSVEKELKAAGVKLPVAFSQRQQRLQGRLRELWDWQRFSNTAEREKLCEQVEALIGSELPPLEVAQLIKAARANWNALGSTDRDAIDKLRERFNQACDTAFKPCAVFYEKEARLRAANMADRSALCKRMEQFIAETDWEHTNIKEVDRFLRQSRDAWKAMGVVDRGAFKQISAKFRSAADTIAGHLHKAREANLRIKEELAKQAEALTGEDIELARAMDGIRDLQARWKTAGPGPRREEQNVWKRFQQAGDAVFARRNAERDAFKREQQGAIAAREAVCEQLETLLKQAANGEGDSANPAALRHSLKDIKQAWSVAEDVPARVRSALDRRFSKLLEDMDEVIRGSEALGRIEAIKHAGQAALLVAEMETAAAAGDSEARAGLEARWLALTDEHNYPAKAYLKRKLLQSRWQKALAGADATSIEQTAIARRLCLKMEVAGGVESPPEAAQERMVLQVERLNHGLGAGEQGIEGENTIEALEREWWNLSGLGADVALPLAQRFLKAREGGYRNSGLDL